LDLVRRAVDQEGCWSGGHVLHGQEGCWSGGLVLVRRASIGQEGCCWSGGLIFVYNLHVDLLD
jgi:hypothetical protein